MFIARKGYCDSGIGVSFVTDVLSVSKQIRMFPAFYPLVSSAVVCFFPPLRSFGMSFYNLAFSDPL